MNSMGQAKPFDIAKREVWEAFKRVKANQGAAGVDAQSIEEFERCLSGNLYKLWNRLASGSYLPPPVRRADIPKANGGVRSLGIPTVGDRIAQEVVRRYLEPLVEPKFHPDSYGYRPGKSAIDAIRIARQRCWRASWVLDLDIEAFFGASGQAWRFQRVQFPHRQGERAAPPGIEPWTHGGNEMS
jgi:RNA-directed DNA polymerase